MPSDDEAETRSVRSVGSDAERIHAHSDPVAAAPPVMDVPAVQKHKKNRLGMGAAADIPWKIYISRGLSAWGDRMWSYGGGLFLTALDETGSLQLTAIYGFTTCLSVILLGPVIGTWIDRSKRLTSAQVFLSIQNLAVALAGGSLAAYFWKEEWMLENWGDYMTTVIGAVVIIIGMIANLASQGSKIVVEKDWIVVIANHDNDKLAAMNSVFRTIDLTCFILAPAILGVMFDFISSEVAAIFIAGWNIISVMVEYALLVNIYKQFPGLSRKEHIEEEERARAAGTLKKRTVKDRMKDVVESWKVYLGQPACNAGIGLACLYMTVLGFDNITVGFCLHQCVPASVMGALMGLSSLVGICGSLSFPYLRKRIKVHRTGLVGFMTLLVAIVPCVVSIILPGSPWDLYWDREEDRPMYDEDEDCEIDSQISVVVFIAGLVMGRYGLWMADISVTQIQQESVEEEHRGTVGGVQSGLNYGMDMIKFLLVIFLPNDDTFGYLIIASFAFVVLGTFSYSTFSLSSTKLAAAAEAEARSAATSKGVGLGKADSTSSGSEKGHSNQAFDGGEEQRY